MINKNIYITLVDSFLQTVFEQGMTSNEIKPSADISSKYNVRVIDRCKADEKV